MRGDKYMDEAWRIIVGLGATAVVAGGAFIAIRYIIGLHL